MERTVEILQHQIEYWYKKDQEMPEHEEEHVKSMIEQGYSQGQLFIISLDLAIEAVN